MRRNWLIASVLVLITVVVFAQVRNFEFVNFDDPFYFNDNSPVWNGLTANNAAWAFQAKLGGLWNPMVLLSFLIDTEIYGKDAGGFHLTNLVLHVLNVLLLFRLVRLMSGDCWKSAVVAALFAVHPLRVESVAWVTERKDLLSAFFGFLAMLAYFRFAHCDRRAKRMWYMAALIAFACSLMSKQMLVTLPFVLLLLDYWPLGRMSWKREASDDKASTPPAAMPEPANGSTGPAVAPQSLSWLIWEKLPFFLLAIVFCGVAISAQGNQGVIATLDGYSINARLSNALVVYVLYIWKTIWSTNLAIFYPHPGESLSALQVGLSTLALISISIIAVRQRRNRPFLIVGWLWYIGTLVPVIGIVQVGAQQMGDRFTYFPSIGLLIAAVWLVPTLVPERIVRILVLPGLAATIVVLMVVARSQTEHWRNSVTIFEQALAVTGPNFVVDTHLGAALNEQQRHREATVFLQRAVSMRPGNALAHFNFGTNLCALREFDEAIVCFQRALRINPSFVQAQHNLQRARYDQRLDDGE